MNDPVVASSYEIVGLLWPPVPNLSIIGCMVVLRTLEKEIFITTHRCRISEDVFVYIHLCDVAAILGLLLVRNPSQPIVLST